MDFKTAYYIVNFFPRLKNRKEGAAMAHNHAMFKIGSPEKYDTVQQYEHRVEWYKEMILEDAEVLQLLDEGLERFYINTAARIMAEIPEKVYLNYCPQCGKLARTPYAKQCRYCAHNWHDIIGAMFKIDKVFALSGKPQNLYFGGELHSGVIETGMKLDLSFHGVAIKPMIESIEFADNITAKKSFPVLVTTIESPEDREYLLKRGVLAVPIIIEKTT